MDVAQKVKEIISEQMGVAMEEVIPTARFQEDLDADSLDVVELIMAMEDEFGISIPDEEAEKIRTVQDAIDYIREYSPGKASREVN